MNKQTEERQASAGQVERPVRPSLLTEKELLDIVDSLIRDRAFNRQEAVAIAMAVGAAVEAEVLERCAKLCEDMRSEPTPYQGELEYRISEKAYEVAQECAAAIRGA